VAICENCLGPLEPLYPASRRLPDRATIAARPQSMWRYREWLPFEGEPVASLDTGFSPLIDAPRLADKLGVARVWVKNDAVSHPSLSFKDRVVSTAINAAIAFGLDTGGLRVDGQPRERRRGARRARRARVVDLHPEDLEIGKVIGTAVYGPNLVRIKGHYDDVNRLCAQLADRFGWGIVNVNLRGYYGEGSKTMAYEIAEQLGWRLPSAIVAPMAGGSLGDQARQGIQGVHRRGARRWRDAARVRHAGVGMRADRPAVGARRLDAGAGDPEHDRAIDRDRESGGRRVRGEGDARVGWRWPARQ
jgi:threonine synthase